MALTVAEFRKAYADKLAKIASGKPVPGTIPCADCGVPLQEHMTGCRYCSDGSVRCSDCYFDLLGAEIEKHPVAKPGSSRG